MGFDWGVNVSVEYNLPLDESLWQGEWGLLDLTLKVLRWKPTPPLPGELASREVGGRDGVKSQRKKAAQDEKAPVEDPEDPPRCPWSPDEFTGRKKELAQRLVNLGEKNLLLLDVAEVIAEAFQFALKDLLGPDQSKKYCLELEDGGAYGEADQGAQEESARLIYTPSLTRTMGGLDVGRGGVNVPWGVKLTPIPRFSAAEEAEARVTLIKICKEIFGVAPTEEPAWRLATCAHGG
uniref:Uncharacterized protein n=1 Tax=Chloropicon laureae TaxID=464258 RepID=A0A7S2Z5P7_9CHLO|mmetsp:Transcript_6320/g.16311  ORF Transcript_6320/g.16311 Transcript_6320/m.16311 type:complete len:236 (+) Transcript_6320:280-987(+)